MSSGDGDDPNRTPRRHARYPVDWRVSLNCKDWHMAGKVAAANASRGGLFLFTPRPPPVGTQLQLTIALPDGTKLTLAATVQHVVTAEQAAGSGGGAGIGVKFDDKHGMDLILLEEMAAAAAAATVAAAGTPAELPELPAPESTPLSGPMPTPPGAPGAARTRTPAGGVRATRSTDIREINRVQEREEARVAAPAASAPAAADDLIPIDVADAPFEREPTQQRPTAAASPRARAAPMTAVEEASARATQQITPPPTTPAAPAPVAGPDDRTTPELPPPQLTPPSPATSAPTTPAPAVAPGPAPAGAAPLARMRVAGPRRELPRGLPVCPVLGLDYGTSYSSVAVTLGDQVYLVPDGEGRVLHPSVVSFPEKVAPIVSWEAKERLAHDPRHTVASAKRLLGQSIHDPQIAGYLQSLPYKTLPGPSGAVLVEIGGQPYAVPQLAAQMISHVRELAEKALGQRFTQVSMSFPVTFAEEQKIALRRAAQLAGLEVVSMVPEPVAGALAYGIGQEKNELVAVYDFGGGTFDFSILDMAGDHVRLVASEGDAWLGGDDFDFAVAQAVADAFWRATKIELRNRAVEWQRLLGACELAKRDLSTEESALIEIPELIETPRRIDLRQRLDRSLFERLTRSLFERSLDVCKACLDRAGLEATDVTQVVMTGGVSRIPFVREGLKRFFERDVAVVVNPDEAIALGAGLRGAQAVEHAVRGVAKR